MLLAQLCQAAQEFRSHAVDASFPLDGFQHEGYCFRPDGFAGRFQVIERQMAKSRQHGVKAYLDFILPRGGHAAQRSSVEGFVERKHFITGFAVRLGLPVAVAARHLDQAVIGFRAAVGEKDLPRTLHAFGHDEFRQIRLLGNLVQVGAVHQRGRLLLQGLRYHGMAMPQHAGGNAGTEVQIALPRAVPQSGAFPADGSHGITAIGMEYVPVEFFFCVHKLR